MRCDTAASGKFSSLIIDKCRRGDSGEYTLSLSSDEGVESATFLVKVIGTFASYVTTHFTHFTLDDFHFTHLSSHRCFLPTFCVAKVTGTLECTRYLSDLILLRCVQDGKQTVVTAMGQRVWVNNKGEMETSSLTICDAQPVDSDDYYCELTWDKGAQEGADSEYIKRQLLQFRVRVSGMKA